MPVDLLKFTDKGIYCPHGRFYVDPWRPVDYAIITHGHSDHAYAGHKNYLCHTYTAPILKARLGSDINVQTLEYNQPIYINQLKVSLHPAGHIPGSAQVRIEDNGFVCVVSGDYKLEADNISTPMEIIKCNVFITESTFGLPVYQWKPQADVFSEINEWWKSNAGLRTCVIGAYSLGKAQRILKNLDHSIGPVYVHGAIDAMNKALSNHVPLPKYEKVTYQGKKEFFKSLVIAPPSALGSSWMRRFYPFTTAFASGWMALRGAKKRKATDRGFILSDHADWSGLNSAVKETGAETIFVTHGYKSAFCRWLQQEGLQAFEIETQFEGEATEEITDATENQL